MVVPQSDVECNKPNAAALDRANVAMDLTNITGNEIDTHVNVQALTGIRTKDLVWYEATRLTTTPQQYSYNKMNRR